MGENRHLIKSLQVNKGYGASCLCKMFLERHWNVNGVKTLLKKWCYWKYQPTTR